MSVMGNILQVAWEIADTQIKEVVFCICDACDVCFARSAAEAAPRHRPGREDPPGHAQRAQQSAGQRQDAVRGGHPRGLRGRQTAAGQDLGGKEGRKEGREEGRKERRKEGRKERRKEGREGGRKEGRKERRKEGRKEMFYVTMHSTHFINGYMASGIW